MAKTFEGKTVLVTGGSRGLGAAIARAFAESGADVAISYVASDEKARAVTADVRKHGVQGEAFKADQADPAQISRLVGDVVDRFGKLDILVNNAAVAWLGARVGADNYDAEKMNQQWVINTLGVVATIRAAAKVSQTGGASYRSVPVWAHARAHRVSPTTLARKRPSTYSQRASPTISPIGTSPSTSSRPASSTRTWPLPTWKPICVVLPANRLSASRVLMRLLLAYSSLQARRLRT